MPKFSPPKREGGFFVTGDEKDELVAAGTEMKVLDVERRSSPFDKDKEQFITTVLIDETERGISFNAGVASRDDFLIALSDYLDNEQDQEDVYIYLTQTKSQSTGRNVYLFKVVGDDAEE